MIRTILRGLNKVGGALVGAVLYPIKSLFVNFMMLGMILAVALSMLVGLPIFVAVMAYSMFNRSLIAALSAWLTTTLILLIGVPLIAAIGLLRQSINTIFDLVRCFTFGVSDGFEHGLFVHVLNRSLFDFLIFSSNLQWNLSILRTTFAARNATMSPEGLAALDADDDIEGDDEIPADLEDVEPSPQDNDITQLEEASAQPTAPFSPLRADEIQLAQGIVGIKTTLDQYNSLYERLKKLDQAMEERGEGHENDSLGNDIDELVVAMDVVNPVLMVKKFQDNNGSWKAVPASTKITDNDNIVRWLTGTNNIHPVFKDKVVADDQGSPEPYTDPENKVYKHTKYIKITYTGMNCCQELREAAKIIRKEIAKNNLSNLPDPAQVITGIQNQISQGFFGQSQPANGAPSNQQNNENTLGLH